MSLKKRLLKNGLSSLLLKLATIAEQLLLVPLFISAWGADYYGEWLTLAILPSIAGLLDLGFASAVANSFILKYVAGDKNEAGTIYRSGLFSLHFIVFFSTILSFFIVLLLNYLDVFDKLLIDKNKAIIVVLILIFSKIVTFYKELYEAFFIASRKYNLSVNIQTIYSICIILASSIILSWNGDIILFSVVNLTITVSYVLIYALIAKNNLSIDFSKGQVLQSEVRNLFKVGFGYLLAKVWEAVFFQGTTFIVRIVVGPVAVAIFNTVRKLSRTIYQANALVVSSMIPELQYCIGEKQLVHARKLFRLGVFIVMVISGLGILFLLTFGPSFYQFWTRKEISPPIVMWVLFIVGIIFNSLWSIASEVILAANKPYSFTIVASIMAVVAVVTSYVCGLYFGLSGVAVGGVVMDVVLCFYLLPFSCRLLSQPFYRLFSSVGLDFKNLK